MERAGYNEKQHRPWFIPTDKRHTVYDSRYRMFEEKKADQVAVYLDEPWISKTIYITKYVPAVHSEANFNKEIIEKIKNNQEEVRIRQRDDNDE